MAVAVVVNGNLTPAEKAQVSSTIEAAVGGNGANGFTPTVSVESQVFNTPAPPPAPPAPTPPPGWMENLPLWIGAGVFGLAMLGIVLRLARRPRKGQQIDIQAAAQMAASLEQASKETRAEQDSVQQRRDIESMAKQNPEEFANLVRTWLSEES